MNKNFKEKKKAFIAWCIVHFLTYFLLLILKKGSLQNLNLAEAVRGKNNQLTSSAKLIVAHWLVPAGRASFHPGGDLIWTQTLKEKINIS